MPTVERRRGLPGVPRSTCYCKPRQGDPAAGEAREAAMRAVGGIRLEMPFAGARETSKGLEKMGFPYGRRAARALMGEMGVRPVHPKPDLSRPGKGAERRPCLPKGEEVPFPDRAWAADVTCIPIGRARMRLAAAIGWLGRRIAGWRLPGGMGAAGAVACMRDAVGAHGAPAMANPGQGPACSSAAYERLLKDSHVLQGMGGEARRAAFVTVGRRSRSLKSGCVKIGEHETPREPRGIVDECVRKHNDRRLHESPDYETPASWCYSGIAAQLAA